MRSENRNLRREKERDSGLGLCFPKWLAAQMVSYSHESHIFELLVLLNESKCWRGLIFFGFGADFLFVFW